MHFLEHVPFEDGANVAKWAKSRGLNIARTRLYKNDSFPAPETIDWLVIMGGPMNIYQYDTYPWLLRERQFISEAINRRKCVLGICLGAQLIADALGGKVTKNKSPEIGFFDVKLNRKGVRSDIFAGFEKSFNAFHWHGDTFSIPAGAVSLAKSKACDNQAFSYTDRVIALQFHLDYNRSSIEKMVRNCSHELVNAPYVQSIEELMTNSANLVKQEELLYKLLDNIAATVGIFSTA
jgi:GMP synthase-like glutamine amidotransferase